MRPSLQAILLGCALPFVARAAVTVKTEQLRPADPSWHFQTIPGPSKSDIARNARVTLVGNRLEPAGASAQVLVNGCVPGDSLDLTEMALLANDNADGGSFVIDLGQAQAVAAVASYSWHEWDVDDGSRGPQVYALYGSADDRAAGWTKIADVDTRPNQTGIGWNGQHGAFITDSAGLLGSFRFLKLDVQRTRSPRQGVVGLTGTLFAEIDVHTAATLPKAGDAMVVRPVPVSDVWLVFKTHLDIGYTDEIAKVLAKYRGPMMDGALQAIEDSRALPPEQRFAWTLAGWPLTQVLAPQQEASRRLRIERAVRDGAIAFHALPFTLHTESNDLEDLVRGLGFSSQLARTYGRPLPISAKMTDVPCHSWVWPTLLGHAGVKFLHLGCNGTSAFVRVPSLFWWEGPDGSRILCAYSIDYGSGLTPPRNWPCHNYLAMVMTGDNHGPPSPADVANLRAQAASALPGVRIHFGTLDDFASAVLTENPELPVVRGDMPDTWIHGWLSMPVEAKAAHTLRPLEPALDALDTELRLWGLTTASLAPALAAAYEQSNLFSEHTFGPWGPKQGPWETGIPNRYIYGKEWQTARANGAFRKYEAAFDDKRAYAHKAEEIVKRELTARLEQLAAAVQGNGPRLVVYNALPWPRSGIVTVNGREDFAKDVPACGYLTLTHLADRAEPPGSSSLSATAISTPHFTATFDLKRGGIASLVEKATGRQLVDQASSYVLGQFLHERFDAKQMLDFHNAYGRAGYSWPKGNLPPGTNRAALTPNNWTLAIRNTAAADIAVLTTSDTLGLAAGFTLTFTFPRQQALLDVEWQVAGKTPEPLPEGGWLCFPFQVAQPQFLLGRLGGPIDPAKDIVAGANRHYFCLSSGVSLTDTAGTGVGLCPIDSPCVSLGEPGLWKFSLDDFPRQPAVFVNLYNNMWNTNFPEWIEGSWNSRVRIWAVGSNVATAPDLAVTSWEARVPLLAAAADGPRGNLPQSQGGLALSRPGVLLTAFGANPDGSGTLLRLWDQTGITADLTVTLAAGAEFTTATPVNLRGEKTGPPLAITTGRFTIRLTGFAPASFLLERSPS